MPSLPSDEEIQAVGAHLGHGPGPYTTKVKAGIIKTIREAERMADVEKHAEVARQDFGPVIAAVYNDLYLNRGIPSDAAGRITAAIAPAVYRETTGGPAGGTTKKETPAP